MATINKRYDFVLFFDVKDGNPNGDPDAGNLPRVDPETGIGLVTDVCLKRKVRNYIQLITECKSPNDIYVKEKAVLGRAHFEAFNRLGIDTGEEARKQIPEDLEDVFDSLTLPQGISITDSTLIIASDVDKKEIKQWIKEENPPKQVAALINAALKDAKPRKPTADETLKGRDEMCKHFYDIRTFGAVMSLKSAPNCGQVRGPVQLTFARSVEPVVTLEHSITRMAVATEAEAEKQHGDNRTMGRKYTVPYGLYKGTGFISAHLAAQTGFSTDDLDLFWKALQEMFEHDHSAARGLMSTRRLVVFEHSSALGNKPAHELFDRLIVRRTTEGPAREFSDYEILLDGKPLAATVTTIPVA